ncbi:uncharacterized protein LOC116194995 isoform X1 [Punica granatum]|uniref:Uncharacterized protein LOC116194995 isoform X1 n=3 Tax=Punica granatum TaxID=22663 RepID=A0A6P8CGC5_PUNGR|nr:uncharacterized protein LOC116194995 isoform X1 [Punica granatum]
MESILARALEYTLKYWLKSFSRDQFKLQGRTVQLSNLDIDGDALHSSIGLPPALNVTTAKVGKLVIVLPSSVSNVQIEPIVVQIDRLDLVLEENQDEEACRSPCSTPSSTGSGWGSGYGFADKIADGMSVEINTVNLLLETCGGGRQKGGAAWASPMASITIRNLMLYTTNEDWEVVNLKEARDFFSNSKFIYVFKKLEWESLSIDLLPHPDMFTESNLARAQGANQRDDDGAKRVFFGGERFLEGISGQAYITVKRTELNRPLGLEVQLHITAAVCPALSEPGLRALLRFLTGLYICLNRGDVDLKAQQGSVEAAGISLVSIVVDHIFLCIKDADFQLDVLMQSLHFSRATVSDGESANNLTTVTIGGLFLRDTFSRPPCTLVQPSMLSSANESPKIPEFAKNFCPPIYPLGEADWQKIVGVPLITLHSLQVKPSPVPPSFASETFINCQPLMIYLQEESCLRIASFLADGIVVSPGVVLPDSSVNSILFILKELDITFPLEMGEVYTPSNKNKSVPHSSFTGAKLHIEDLLFSESPSLKLKLLNLEKDPACFCLWEDQPIDASQKKWTTKASNLNLSLEASSSFDNLNQSQEPISDLWICVEVKDVCVEVAMATADGGPLTDVPPPGGILRVGVACGRYLSNSSVEQLFFVLDLYAYIGKISEKIALAGKSSRKRKIEEEESTRGRLMDKVPSDTAVSLAVSDLQLRFLESSSVDIEGMPLVQFAGEDFFIKVTHRTLGGAIAVSSIFCWESIEIDCIDTKSGSALTSTGNGQLTDSDTLRAVLWIHNKREHRSSIKYNGVPFLDISTVQVIPFNELDKESHSLNLSACISGIRLGGGMNYVESLLHRFGILGPDGGPGEGLLKGIENLSSSPLAKLFKASPLTVDEIQSNGKEDFLHLARPDDVDVSVELKDWLFALEGPEEMTDRWEDYDHADVCREERSWHMMFQRLQIAAKSKLEHGHGMNCNENSNGMSRYPLESVIVSIEGLQAVKPHAQKEILLRASQTNGIKETVQTSGGVDVEARMVISDENGQGEMGEWMVENLKFSVKKPIEAVVTKEELQHLVFLCKSEADSMGRIVAGVLCLLKLEGSIGHAAIDQLRNLGSEGLDRILTPDKLSRVNSPRSFGLNSPRLISEALNPSLLTTVASIEEAVSDSRAKCAALTAALDSPGSSEVEQLSQRLEQMEFLLKQLRTQI